MKKGPLDRNRREAEDVTQSPGEKHSRQGDDEGWCLEVLDHQAHQKAQARREQYGDGNRQRSGHPGPVEHGNDHGGGRDHRADRQIDTAGDDYYGHPDCGQSQEGIVGEEIQEHPEREEVSEEDAADDEKDDKHQGRCNNRQIALDERVPFEGSITHGYSPPFAPDA